MIADLTVKVGPQVYRYSEGAIDLIPEILTEHQAKNILVVHGTTSWEKAKLYLKALYAYEGTLSFVKYSGECSYNEGERLASIVNEHDSDFVIGVGGGKLSDVVLYACHLSNTSFGLVPTLPSNCAPWTPLSVMYKDNGMAEGKTEHVMRQAAFLLTDPRLVIDAPVEYFVAGIADTLAKWYESDLILQQEDMRDEPFLQLAREATEICKNQILDKSFKAIQDMKDQKVSKEFLHVSAIVFGLAGLVGGLGDKYARNTAAHAMHDALSAYLPDIHQYLHGEIVAYGIFYQLALEEKWAMIQELIPFYKALQLPMSLTEMGVYPLSETQLNKIVQLVNSKAKVHLLPIDINESILKKAVIDLENFIAKTVNF